MPGIRVLLVDDHPLMRRGIASLLSGDPEIEVVGEASDGYEAFEQARELRPDVVLMDVRMPGCDGLTATRMIKAEMPGVRIVMLTASEDRQILFEAVSSGAQGYLLKRVAPRELFLVVRMAADGGVSLPPELAGWIMAEFDRLFERSSFQGGSDLIPLEREILKLVAGGLPHKQVANSLGVSEKAVSNHLRDILEKLHLMGSPV